MALFFAYYLHHLDIKATFQTMPNKNSAAAQSQVQGRRHHIYYGIKIQYSFTTGIKALKTLFMITCLLDTLYRIHR